MQIDAISFNCQMVMEKIRYEGMWRDMFWFLTLLFDIDWQLYQSCNLFGKKLSGETLLHFSKESDVDLLVARRVHICACFCLFAPTFWKGDGDLRIVLCHFMKEGWLMTQTPCCNQIRLKVLHSEVEGTLKHLPCTPYTLALLTPSSTSCPNEPPSETFTT